MTDWTPDKAAEAARRLFPPRQSPADELKAALAEAAAAHREQTQTRRASKDTP